MRHWKFYDHCRIQIFNVGDIDLMGEKIGLGRMKKFR